MTMKYWSIFLFVMCLFILSACRDDSIEEASSIIPVTDAELTIGDKIYAVVGDTLKIYFNSIVLNSASGDYGLALKCDKGNNYSKYWRYIPKTDDVGESFMDLQLFDFKGNVLVEKQVLLITREARNPESRRNLLCLGNSLMAAGQTPIELSRRLKGTSGLIDSPESLSLTNYSLVGRVQNSEQTVGWEGTPGWTWQKYIDSFDIQSYVDQYCEGQMDYIYLQLGINELLWLEPFADQSFIINGAKTLIDRIHKSYPSCKVLLGSVLLPSQNGGLGNKYPANIVSGIYGEKGFSLKVHRLNKAYNELANSADYASFTYFIDNNAQFDCLNVYPKIERPSGNYVPGNETIDTDGIHPANIGYWQIAAGIFRALIGIEEA